MTRVLLVVLLLCQAAVVAAAAAPQTLHQAVQKAQQADARVNVQREQRFIADKKKQAALLHKARAKLEPVKARTRHLRAQRKQLEAKLNTLPAQLEKKIGNVQQLVHIVRQTAADLQAQAADSVITAQYPDRVKALERITQSQKIPTAADVRSLWQLLLQQIEAGGEVADFTAPVTAPGGNTAPRQVTRVGSFVAFADGNYLLYSSGTGLKQLAGQPEHAVRALAADLAQAGSGLHPVWIAPPGTAVLQHLARRSTLKWRLRHSGAIGYVMVAVGGIVGLVMLYLLLIMTSRGVVRLLEARRPEALLRYAESRRRFSKSFSVSLLICVAVVWLLHGLFEVPPVAATKAPPAIPIQMVAMSFPSQQTPGQVAQASAGGGGNHSAAPPSPPAVPGLPQPSWDTVPVPKVDVRNTLPDIHFKADLASNFSTGAAFGGYAGSGAGGGGGGGTGTGQGPGSGAGTGGQLLIPLSTARPQIPELACKRGIQGYAIAEFNVNPDGRVSDIRIVDAKPRGIFEHAMVESLSHWDYQSWDGTQAYRVNFKFKFRLKDCPLNWSTP